MRITADIVLSSSQISHRMIRSNGINVHIAEAGRGPLVLMLHGFPELWYSWRHQLPAIAGAGYHAAAIDLRGYGKTAVSKNVNSYSILNLSKDISGVIETLNKEKAIIVGHDWGANIAWAFAQIYPQHTSAVVALSVPYYSEPPGPVAKIKKYAPNKFNFVVYTQKPGIAEAELGENIERTFRLLFYSLSGDAPKGLTNTLFMKKPADAQMLDSMPAPLHLPDWLTQRNLNHYVEAFEKTGFQGALNIYRNIDKDYKKLQPYWKTPVKKPVLFLGGKRDGAIQFGSLDPMEKLLPNLRKVVILPEAGHWVQQERPEKVTAEILAFLKKEKL